MNEEEKIRIVCRGRTKNYWLLLHYLRKVIVARGDDYSLTYKHYRFKLRVDKSNCWRLLGFIKKHCADDKNKMLAFENLLEIIRLKKPSMKKK